MKPGPWQFLSARYETLVRCVAVCIGILQENKKKDGEKNPRSLAALLVRTRHHGIMKDIPETYVKFSTIAH